MDYHEALDYIQNLTKFGMNFGLERIEKLLSLLGNPHKNVKFIHVGGTNGKGSTCMMLTSILKNAGYNVGLFTSPHIHSYRERFTINGQCIAEERIANLITKIRPLLEQMVEDGFEHPTEFEVNTALAFQYFYEEKVDIAVIEVGLGGLIDSTNVITPLVSIITNVTMDHMNYLGNTIEEIAAVKAGIIKKGIPILTGAQNEALKVIEEISHQKEAPLTIIGRDVKFEKVKTDRTGSSFHFFGRTIYRNLKIPLLGVHQISNAVLAVKTAEILQDAGFKITEKNIREGLLKTSWPARLEVVNDRPVILIDVAHNVDGMKALKNTIENVFKFKKMILVLSLLEDKEREKITEIICPLANTVIVTRPNSYRAGDWDRVADFASHYSSEVISEPDIANAIKLAISRTGQDDLLCVTGSFYMVSDARKVIIENCL